MENVHAKVVFGVFRKIAKALGAEDVDREALTAAHNCSYNRRIPCGNLGGFNVMIRRHIAEDHLTVDVDWPAIGSVDWTKALAFADGLQVAARRAGIVEGILESEPLSPEVADAAKKELAALADEVRNRLGAKTPVRDVVRAIMEKLDE